MPWHMETGVSSTPNAHYVKIKKTPKNLEVISRNSPRISSRLNVIFLFVFVCSHVWFSFFLFCFAKKHALAYSSSGPLNLSSITYYTTYYTQYLPHYTPLRCTPLGSWLMPHGQEREDCPRPEPRVAAWGGVAPLGLGPGRAGFSLGHEASAMRHESMY